MAKSKLVRKEVYQAGVQVTTESIINAVSQNNVTVEAKESSVYEDGTQTLTIKIIQRP